MSRPSGVLCLLLAVLAAAIACADGMFVPAAVSLNAAQSKPSSAAQKGIMIRRGQEEILLLQTTYQGPSGQFAWVIPVPSRPTAIFPAEPAFLNETFLYTEPVVVTDLGQDRKRRSRLKTASLPLGPPAPGAAGGPAGPPPVEVLEERNVGDYHAVVLAARGGQALEAWLTEHRYQIPDGAGLVLDGYVRRGWYFVALKMQERAARAQPVLTEVAPLGLAFPHPGGDLVFPLAISRLSAPPYTSLLLCTIGQQTYQCETIPTQWLDKRIGLSRRETYGDLRRRLTRNPTRLFCEYAGGPPFRYPDLSYSASNWVRGEYGGFNGEQATRFFGLITPDEMTDLVFKPESARREPYQVLVRRQGTLVERGTISSVMFLKPGSYEQQHAQASPQPSPPPKPARRDSSSTRLIIAIFVLIPVVVIWLMVRMGKQPPPGTALLALLIALPLLVFATAGETGLMGRPGLPLLGAVHKAVEAFLADTGCLPAETNDLAARQAPPLGLDPSGNQVPLKGWRGPYLNHVLPEVVKGGSVVCDPLNLFMVDSTGFSLACEPSTPDAAAHAAERKPWELKPYWSSNPEQAKRKMDDYWRWLSTRRGHKLVGLYQNTSNTPGRDTSAVVVDRTDLSYFPLPGRRGAFGTNGTFASYWEARRVDQQALSFAGLTGIDQPFKLVNRTPLPFYMVMAVAPDGSLAVRDHNEVFVITPAGRRISLPELGFGPSGATFSPDSRYVYYWFSGLVRYSLPDGTRAVAVSDMEHQGVVGNRHGILYVDRERRLKLYKHDGTVVTLADDIPRNTKVMALGAEYAYWASGDSSTPEDNTIFRVTLKDRVVKPIAHYKNDYQQRVQALEADGAELYIGYTDDGTFKKVVLLTAVGKLITLGEKASRAAPVNLPLVQ